MMKEFLVSALKRLLMVDKIAFSWYNNSVYKSGAEVYDILNTQDRKYGYLFRTTSLRQARLNELIVTDDFIKAADAIIESGRSITDIDIYNIAKSVFFPMHKQYLTEGFKDAYKNEYGSEAYREWSHRYRIFGHSTKAFSIDLFGSSEQWEKDFQEYVLTVK